MHRLSKILCGIGAAALLAAPALASDPTDAMIATAAALTQEYDLPAGLLLAVAETESDFDPDCRTGKCWGLMQIHSSYAREYAALAGLDEYDLFDYGDSLRIGAYLLSDYMTRYEGDIHFTLMAYNLGEYGALARRRDGVQSTGYSRKVVGKIERYAEVERAAQKVEEAETEKVEEADALTAVAAGIHELIREVLFK